MGARRGGGGREVGEQRPVVERKVRRGDHGHSGHAQTGRVLGERHRVGRRLGATVHRHLELSRRRSHEELGDPLPLSNGEQDALARRAEREQPVQPRPIRKSTSGANARLVELSATVPERSRRSSERPGDHPPLPEKCW